MTEKKLTLLEPTVELASAYLAMVDEYQRSPEKRFEPNWELARKDFAAFVRLLHDRARGEDLPPGWVPATRYWMVRNGSVIVGRSRLRHRLTPALQIEGGHIGYDIRPSQRRKGYGTLLLALTLAEAKAMGLKRVLVTCDSDNVASARIIRKNGGKFDGKGVSPRSGKSVWRYWIDLEGS